ncbi:hypothetical protein [Ureibacillus aquaedulcis]|uniref:FecR protein domain-containing protein n=1 Tax=Ureibacillus aquaedulcis TaxID=3058421 RepID=A0ABT8GUM8_9BACL|nr:hypothetical protein [Ureibacillus sp. BA0131]MDN4495115.1 hypothetical protein [Ureibacillus sp. BA0131]
MMKTNLTKLLAITSFMLCFFVFQASAVFANVLSEITVKQGETMEVITITEDTKISSGEGVVIPKVVITNGAKLVEFNADVQIVEVTSQNNVELVGEGTITDVIISTSKEVALNTTGDIHKLVITDPAARLEIKEGTKISKLVIPQGTKRTDIITNYEHCSHRFEDDRNGNGHGDVDNSQADDNNTTPEDENTRPEENPPSGDGSTQLTEENPHSEEGNTPPAQDNPSSDGENTPPVDDNSPSGDENIPPAGENPPPAPPANEAQAAKLEMEDNQYGYGVYQASYSSGREAVVSSIESLMKNDLQTRSWVPWYSKVTIEDVTWVNPPETLPAPERVYDSRMEMYDDVKREYFFDVLIKDNEDGSTETAYSVKGIVQIQ